MYSFSVKRIKRDRKTVKKRDKPKGFVQPSTEVDRIRKDCITTDRSTTHGRWPEHNYPLNFTPSRIQRHGFKFQPNV